MKFNAHLIAAAAAALMSATAQAGVVHIYDLTFDGSIATYNQSAAGQTLAVGDQVQLTVHTVGGYWSLPGATNLWAAIVVQDSATRTGDVVMSLMAGSNTLETHAANGINSSFVHIVNGIVFGPADFDGFTWLYTLTNTTSATNTLGELLVSNVFVGGAPFVRGELTSAIPEPTSVLLAGLGLAAAGLARRRKA